MKNFVRTSSLAVFCLFLFPAAALADGVVLGPCGNQVFVGLQSGVIGPCTVQTGGTASYSGVADASTVDRFFTSSAVNLMGFTGQSNTFQITVMAFPFSTINSFTFQGILNLFGTVTILEPGASVDIFATGEGPGTITITRHFENTATFSLIAFGNLNPSTVATDRLIVVINGAASFSGSTAFRGTLPEPTSLLLLGSGLAGIAMKMRKKLRRDKNVP
jgi:PEP-CTERM motif